MKLIIIGAGASGVVAAINYKRLHKEDDVLIIEHLDKPLKKILATGNGKCNLGNDKLNINLYNNPEFAKTIIGDYDYKKFFNSISIQTKSVNNLVYPVSESAVSVRDALLDECEKLGIKINLSESIKEYRVGSQIEVATDKNTYKCDKLAFASGLLSSPKLGTDGTTLELIKRHGYVLNETKPGLSPIYTKEKTKSIDGIRCKSNVKLFDGQKLIHEESGEVLFKEHGLSGIVIFNVSSVISRNTTKPYGIVLDLLPDFSEDYVTKYFNEHNIDDFLRAFINPKLALYLKERFKTNNEICKAVKYLTFTYDKSYGFDYSQVTVGGISIKNVDSNLMSKLENNVYFIGELVDIDGPCGGYNLTWAFASAMRIK